MDQDHQHHHHGEHEMAQPATTMDHSHQEHDTSGSHHEMNMFFHANSHAVVLFSFWTTSSPLDLAWSCAIIIVLGILYEGLKSLREHLMIRDSVCSRANGAISSIGHQDNHKDGNSPRFVTGLRRSVKNSGHVLQTLLHGVQVFYSYCLMLIFMTYNIWLCAAVVIGAIIGYFFFSWRRHSCNGCNPGGNYALREQCH